MSTSLNVGYWSWDDRWKYLDQVDYTPNEAIDASDASKTLPATNVPGKPYRPQQEYDMHESLYTSTYGNAKLDEKPPASHPSKARAGRVRGKMRAPADTQHHHLDYFWHEPVEHKAQVPEGEKGFRVWGRSNASYCVMPYETEAQRNYKGRQMDWHPQEPRYSMSVHRKPYKEAVARNRNTEKMLKERKQG